MDFAAYCTPIMTDRTTLSPRPSSRRRSSFVRFVTAVVVGATVVGACASGEMTSEMSSTPAATSGVVPGSTPVVQPSIAPSPTASPAPEIGKAGPELDADPEPFAMNLASSDDFVAQYTFEWCVGASLQMALNMSTDRERASRTDQGKLWEMARDRSYSPFGGANPRGWTAALNDLGIGPYRLVSVPTLDEALILAAESIRATARSVGLVMWRGRHAWVMSGFESSADPRRSDNFDVTGIRVHDPLYPNGSSVWGKSPKPNSLISPATLAKQFAIRDSTRVNLGVPAGYLLVLPVIQEA